MVLVGSVVVGRGRVVVGAATVVRGGIVGRVVGTGTISLSASAAEATTPSPMVTPRPRPGCCCAASLLLGIAGGPARYRQGSRNEIPVDNPAGNRTSRTER